MIKEIADKKQKFEITINILTKLPDWFGIPEAINDYAIKSENHLMFGYFIDNLVVGFITIYETSEYAVEVEVIGILENYHHQGIGRKLIEKAEEYVVKNGKKILHVKTVAPIAKYDSYLKTYAFYIAVGFIPLQVLPLWDEVNPCLLLIKYLENK